MGDLNLASRPTRGTLVRWIGWFGISNALLFALVGLRFLFAYGMPESGVAILYVVLAYVAHFSLLAFLPMMLLLAPIALVVPRKGLIFSLAVVFAAVGLTILVLDTNIFAEYRYHLSRLTVEIFATSTWVFAAIIFTVLLLFQAMLAGNVWQRVVANRGGGGIKLAVVLVLVWCGGQGIHIWADAIAYAPVTGFTRYMPVYFPMKAKRRLAKLGWVDPDEVEQQRLLQQANAPVAGQLRYPLNPLSCATSSELPNILFILVDALRPDHIKAEFTPRIARVAAQGQHFKNHYSGGNSSRMGLFSFFYGLPSTYWQTFYDLQRPPVLMEQLQASGYEIKAFSAVGFGSPAQIDRTVFAAVSLADRYAASAERDRNGEITQAWENWIANRGEQQQPFFSMLYYDPGLSPGSAAGPDVKGELARRYESYRLGIAAVDREVARLLDNVAFKGLDRDTLIIIASDHGYEFDELGLGNIGHGSNYGPWQLRSVLIFDWPGRVPQVYEHRSAHQDLPGTLLKEVLGCTNPYSDYSSGGNLFDEEPWQWIMAGSYSSHAIVEPDKIVVTYPGGLIEILGPDYRPVSGLQLDPQRIEEVMLEMRRFYK